MRRAVWGCAAVGALLVGMAVVAAPSVAAPPPSVKETTTIECTGTFGNRELKAWGYFYTDNVSGGGEAEFHDPTTDPTTPVWGTVADTSTYDGRDFVLDVAFTYGEPGGGEEGAAEAGEPGTSAGTMTITGTATPSGEPELLSGKSRDGNAWVWWSVDVQALAGEATITAATRDVAFTYGAGLTCGGWIVVETVSETRPATSIHHGSYSTADCVLSGPEQSFLQLNERGDWLFGIGVNWDTGAADWFAAGTLDRAGSSITGDLRVYLPPHQQGQVVGLDLTVGSKPVDRGTERTTGWTEGQQSAQFDRWVEYPLTGTALLPDGSEVTISDCALRTTWSTFRLSSQAGQKPGGKVPANDLPAGAVALAPGTVEQSTRGAAVGPEAPCVIDSGAGTYEVPFGRTVWYAFTGTGQDVTISTLGSSRDGYTWLFPTVVGIYTAGSMEQVTCAIDGFDPEQPWAAEATVPTTNGTAYLVQVGGMRSLAHEVSPDPAWGNLVLTRR